LPGGPSRLSTLGQVSGPPTRDTGVHLSAGRVILGASFIREGDEMPTTGQAANDELEM